MNIQKEFLEETVSTNTLARERAKAGAPEGTALIAFRQTGGKGRSGRSFYSPEDTGLYLSLILRPDIRAEESLRITTLCAVAAARAVESFRGRWVPSPLGEENGERPDVPAEDICQIKWVNDLLVKGRKVAGILAEAGFSGRETPDFVVLGIGINVAEPREGFPLELRSIAGAVLSREEALRIPGFYEKDCLRARVTELADRFLEAFDEGYEQLRETGRPIHMDEYRRRSVLIGKKVRLLDTEHRLIPEEPEVTVLDIGDEAELVVAYPDGRRRALSCGEVSARTAEDPTRTAEGAVQAAEVPALAAEDIKTKPENGSSDFSGRKD